MKAKQHPIKHQPLFFKWQTALIATLLALASFTSRATVEVFTSSGTWTCPADVTTVTVECWGGGGAGGSVTNAASSGGANAATVGGGGAGGAYVIKTNVSVTVGNSYTVTVGLGGTPPALSPIEGARGDGGDSWFNSPSTVLAKGGGGGMSKNAARPASGLGGTNLLGSIGDIINLGGLGADGDGSVNVQAAGGGGGSGGTSGAGTNAVGSAGSAAAPGGGAGGNGRSGTSSGAGFTGSLPGGAGGGGEAAAAKASQLGGAGANGKVNITYAFPAPSYTWVATSGSADWTAAASWSPSRTTPATNDVLVFTNGGSSTATSVPTQTIGKFQVASNTVINLQSDSANTLSIGEIASDSLTVASGSQLNVNGTSALLVNVSTGAKGSISGSMTFSATAATAHSLTATAASGITFNSGATFTQGTNDAGNVFGSTGTSGTVVFASGSTFVQQGGNNPFALTQPNSKVIFQSGSLFSLQQSATPSVSGRTYADFEYNVNATNAASGANPLNIDNLSVVQGGFNITMAGGFNLNSNATVAAGALLNLSNTVATFSGRTVTVNGTLSGTATISGGAAITITANGTLSPGPFGTAIGTLTLATAPVLNGTNFLKIDRNGGSPLADKIVLSSGTLAYGGTLIVTNIGAPLQAGDTFTNFSAASYSGAFTATNLPALAGGLVWDTSQLGVSGVIGVVSPPANADYSVAQTGSANVFASSNLTYTVTVSNAGPALASSVVATDSLPAGVTFVSATGGGANSGGTVSWSFGDLAINAFSNVSVTVTAPANGPLTNVVVVSSSTPDPDLTSNTNSLITTVAPIPVGAISLSGGQPLIKWSVQPGVNYSILWSTNVMGPYSSIANNLTFVGTNGSFTDTIHTSLPTGFYKITSP